MGTKVGTIESLDDSSDIPHCLGKAAESPGKILRQAEMRTPDPLLRSNGTAMRGSSREGTESQVWCDKIVGSMRAGK